MMWACIATFAQSWEAHLWFGTLTPWTTENLVKEVHPPKFNSENPWKPWWLEYYTPIRANCETLGGYTGEVSGGFFVVLLIEILLKGSQRNSTECMMLVYKAIPCESLKAFLFWEWQHGRCMTSHHVACALLGHLLTIYLYIFVLITLGLKPVSKLMQNRNQGTHAFMFLAWFRWSDPAKSQNCCAFGNAACLRKFEALFEMWMYLFSILG